jgi:hypothetical protein
MVGVCKIEITESEAELKELLREQKTVSSKERVQLLYLLKSQQVESVTQAASILGRNRVTLERWLGKYRDGGIERLLASYWKRGRKRHIPVEADQKRQTRLEQSDGFNRDGAIQQWLKQDGGVEVSDGGVHLQVRYRLKAKLKVPRSVSVEQHPQPMSALKNPCCSFSANAVGQASNLCALLVPRRVALGLEDASTPSDDSQRSQAHWTGAMATRSILSLWDCRTQNWRERFLRVLPS